MASVLAISLVKGDVIIERVAGKKRMTPVTKVEVNACSSRGVHVNRNMCFDATTPVEVAYAEMTLADLAEEMTGLGDLESDYEAVRTGPSISDEESLEEMVDRLVKA